MADRFVSSESDTLYGACFYPAFVLGYVYLVPVAQLVGDAHLGALVEQEEFGAGLVGRGLGAHHALHDNGLFSVGVAAMERTGVDTRIDG